MATRITMQDVADATGVSKGLVSKALTGKYGVSDETRTLITMKAIELGYDVSHVRKRGAAKRRVLLLVSSRLLMREKYWQEIIVHLEKELTLRKIGLEYFVYEENGLTEEQTLKLQTGKEVGRVLIHNNYDFLMQELEKRDLPTVIVDPRLDTPTKFMQIKADNAQSNYALARRLVEMGHRHLLFYGATGFSVSFYDRYRGARLGAERYAKLGVTFDEVLFDNSDYAFEDGEDLKIAVRRAQADAIFCANDLIALSCYRTLKSMGLEAGRDVSVIGFDNIPESTLVSPELSTVTVPRAAMGAQAARSLAEAIETGVNPFTSIELACTTVIRASVRHR